MSVIALIKCNVRPSKGNRCHCDSIAGASRSSISSPPCRELTALKVGFVSLSETLDLTTPSDRAFAGMLAVVAEFERDILRDQDFIRPHLRDRLGFLWSTPL